MYNAFALYTETFQNLEHISVEWDRRKKCFRYIPLSSGKIWLWVWNIFFIIGFVNFGLSFLGLLRCIIFEKLVLSNFNIITVVTEMILIIFGIGITLALIFYGRDFVDGWNRFVAAEMQSNIFLRRIIKFCNNYKPHGFKKIDKDKKNNAAAKTSDLPGLASQHFVKMFAIYPFILIPSSMVLNLDISYFFINEFETHLPIKYQTLFVVISSVFIRLPIVSIGIIEICRLFALLIILLTSCLQSCNNLLSRYLNELVGDRNWHQLFEWKESKLIPENRKFLQAILKCMSEYQQHVIIQSSIAPLQECCTSILLAGKYVDLQYF